MAVVDTNVRKVILTQFQPGIKNHESRIKEKKPHKTLDSYFLIHDSDGKIQQMKITNQMIENIADHLLPKGKAYEWESGAYGL